MEKETKNRIFQSILNTGFFNNLHEDGKIMDFLKSIWDLEILPSTDARFNNLESDIRQHFIDNNDWDINILFIEKLSLLENDDKFKIFIEKIVNFIYHKEKNDSSKLVFIINELLKKEKYELVVSNYTKNGDPQYSVAPITDTDSEEFLANKIPFFVDKNPEGYSRYSKYPRRHSQYPHFILSADDWDDYSTRSTFNLFYFEDAENQRPLGSVKIIHKTEISKSSGWEIYMSKNYIPDNFLLLSNEFCSLGQTESYYNDIKLLFPENYKNIFWALKDCAIFSQIEDAYCNHRHFYSLIRDNLAERILRQEKYVIEGHSIVSMYQFSYKFTPRYSEDEVSVDFKFDKEGILPNRIYAIIGENGVGKTQFITKLPLDIAEKNSDSFSPHVPIFSKIIAISNSYYDNFTIPKKTSLFNYVYCGLSKLNKNEKEILSPLELTQRLHKSCKDIQEKGRIKSLKNILDNFLSSSIIDELFNEEEESGDKTLVFNYNNFSSVCNNISSGQSSLMFVFCNIVSHIRYDSLLLFDEPETHLHPNAVTSLMNAIYELLEEYQSYGIICTHSPLIIREFLSRNVYVMERKNNYPLLKKIGLESFGENLTVLTEEIFGNKEVSKFYKNNINKLVEKGYGYDEIVSLLETTGVPLSLNITIFIKSLMESKNEKHKKI